MPTTPGDAPASRELSLVPQSLTRQWTRAPSSRLLIGLKAIDPLFVRTWPESLTDGRPCRAARDCATAPAPWFSAVQRDDPRSRSPEEPVRLGSADRVLAHVSRQRKALSLFPASHEVLTRTYARFEESRTCRRGVKLPERSEAFGTSKGTDGEPVTRRRLRDGNGVRYRSGTASCSTATRSAWSGRSARTGAPPSPTSWPTSGRPWS